MTVLQEFRKQFDTAILTFLDEKITDGKTVHHEGAVLLKYIKEFILNGGKRFRPALFYHAFKYAGGEEKIDPLRTSFVFELFHTFALLHDDIIDNAVLRRGKRTTNSEYGTAPALLAGDLALMLADEIFYTGVFSGKLGREKMAMLQNLYDDHKQKLIIGQYLDYVHIPENTLIMDLKTSRYSFVNPVRFGLILGGNDHVNENKWDTVMGKLGMLFQLKDDYEGIFGDEQIIGKSATSDIEEGKKTKIIELFHDRASSEEYKRFITFFGKPNLSRDNHQWWIRNLKDNKIDSAIQNQIQTGSLEIMRILQDEKRKTSFHKLIDELVGMIVKFA